MVDIWNLFFRKPQSCLLLLSLGSAQAIGFLLFPALQNHSIHSIVCNIICILDHLNIRQFYILTRSALFQLELSNLLCLAFQGCFEIMCE